MTLPDHVRWRPIQGTGLEHLTLHQTDDTILGDSVVIGESDAHKFGLAYRLTLDRSWHLREAVIALAGQDRTLILRSDGAGTWRDGDDALLPDLAGCIDIDLAATPFTNTLPIRRLTLPLGEAKEIRVVYIPVPDLRPIAVAQRYTRNAVDRYFYEGLSSNFSAELQVDGNGLVIDYPGLFERLA